MNAVATILNEVAIATLRNVLLLLVVLAVGVVDKRSIVVDVVVELYADDVEWLLHPECCEPVNINIDSATIMLAQLQRK